MPKGFSKLSRSEKDRRNKLALNKLKEQHDVYVDVEIKQAKWFNSVFLEKGLITKQQRQEYLKQIDSNTTWDLGFIDPSNKKKLAELLRDHRYDKY